MMSEGQGEKSQQKIDETGHKNVLNTEDVPDFLS